MRFGRAFTVTIGALLSIGAVVGVLFFGQIVNPPSVRIVVALAEIPAGTLLTRDLVAIDAMQLDPKVRQAHLTEAELPLYLNHVVVEQIHAYQPVAKAAISAEENPAAANRLALALTDPGLVAMVIPVSLETAPDAIRAGDYVDVVFGTRPASDYGERMSTEPTATPGYFNDLAFSPETAVNAEGPLARAATAVPTIEPLLLMPVAKTLVSEAKVLTVIREEKSQTRTDESGRTVTVAVPGNLIGLVVVVPREAQELVQFAIDNGSVRISLLSAQLQPGDPRDRQPTLGMTYNDLVALVRMDRERLLATALPDPVIGPGAYAVESRLQATQQARPDGVQAQGLEAPSDPAPTATPTPAP